MAIIDMCCNGCLFIRIEYFRVYKNREGERTSIEKQSEEIVAPLQPSLDARVSIGVLDIVAGRFSI